MAIVDKKDPLERILTQGESSCSRRHFQKQCRECEMSKDQLEEGREIQMFFERDYLNSGAMSVGEYH